MTDTERLEYIAQHARHIASATNGRAGMLVDLQLVCKSYPRVSLDDLRVSIDAALLAAAWMTLKEQDWSLYRQQYVPGSVVKDDWVVVTAWGKYSFPRKDEAILDAYRDWNRDTKPSSAPTEPEK